MKKRIAVIDLLFSWPPDSGARIDLKEILQRLQGDFEVKLFLLDYEKRFFAGKIRQSLPFPVEIIKADAGSYHSHAFLKKIRAAVDVFSPHAVFIADSWHIKPYLFEALAGYPRVLRFYCYETLCLKKNGVFTYKKKICYKNHLESRKDFWFCQWCALSSMLWHREKVFWDEYRTARAYLPGYSQRVRGMFQEAEAVICYNSFIAGRIEPYNRKVCIVPSGVDTEKFTPQPFPEERVKKILFTGRAYDYFKGLQTILQAGEILYRKRKDFLFRCTNEGEGKKGEYWELIPWSTPEEIPGVYAGAHICVTPSIWPEPFGIVALEAMASGRPVIASRVGGLQNIVTHGEDGFLVPPADPSALAEHIEILLDSPNKIAEMGNKGRQKVEKHFSWDTIYSQYYVELFEKTCQNSK